MIQRSLTLLPQGAITAPRGYLLPFYLGRKESEFRQTHFWRTAFFHRVVRDHPNDN